MVHFISQQVDIKAPVKLITIPSVPAELLKMDSVSEPFTSPKCLRSNFSLSHLYIMQQKDNENSQTYQIEVFVMIQHNVLRTNSQGNVLQFEGRINNQILGVKGLNLYLQL